MRMLQELKVGETWKEKRELRDGKEVVLTLKKVSKKLWNGYKVQIVNVTGSGAVAFPIWMGEINKTYIETNKLITNL